MAASIGNQFQQLHVARLQQPRPIVLRLSCLGGEMHQLDPLIIKGSLQRSTDMALTRLDGDGKVGVGMVCAHSGPIYSQFGYGITHGMSDKHAGIVDEIDRALPGSACATVCRILSSMVLKLTDSGPQAAPAAPQASGQVLLRQRANDKSDPHGQVFDERILVGRKHRRAAIASHHEKRMTGQA